jgi:RHS repeat-associated protein
MTNTRGRDLSGSLAGAGGIGGLLARSHGYSGGNWSIHTAYHADGNGNVTALASSAGALQASYRYDPYGRYLAGGGPLATANVLRFSSKPWVGFAGSATSGLYYYGYRFYDPYLQRWVNRDLLGEEGGLNLFTFVRNSPLRHIDANGLYGEIVINDGRIIKTPTVADFVAALESASTGSVVCVTLSGHAGPEGIYFGDSDDDFLTAGESSVYTSSGQDITELLRNALAPESRFNLYGCATAYGDENVSKRLSCLLPDTTVYGVAGSALGFSSGIWGFGRGLLGDIGRGYVIGRKVGYRQGLPIAGSPGGGGRLPKIGKPKLPKTPYPRPQEYE